MNHSSSLITKLKKVRGLGAAHHGVGHWWYQRLTALALIPLSVWFVYSLITAMLIPDVAQVADWFASPVNALALTLMLIAMFFHVKLGLQVVIEDYVHSPAAKYVLLIGNSFICWIFAAISLLSILKLHLLMPSGV